MKTFALAAMLLAMTTAAYAEEAAPPAGAPTPTCKATAAEKKLAGAALNSFMKKCQTDATKECSTAAADKKLNGAAKTSFTKKCVTDHVGA